MFSAPVHKQQFRRPSWLKIAFLCAHTLNLCWQVELTGHPGGYVSQIAFELQICSLTVCVQVDVSSSSRCITFHSSDAESGFPHCCWLSLFQSLNHFCTALMTTQQPVYMHMQWNWCSCACSKVTLKAVTSANQWQPLIPLQKAAFPVEGLQAAWSHVSSCGCTGSPSKQTLMVIFSI